MKELKETNPTEGIFPAKNFGEILAEYVSSGWVHSVTWSPNGSKIAFVGHDSTITFIDVAGGGTPQTLRLTQLPLADVIFTSENGAVAGGHDYAPLHFVNSGGNWSFSSIIAAEKKAEAPKASGAKAAMSKFQNLDTTGKSARTEALTTIHQNSISWVRPYEEKNGNVSQFSTSGLDGKLVLWNSPA